MLIRDDGFVNHQLIGHKKSRHQGGDDGSALEWV